LLANRHQAFPEWLLDVVILGIEGGLKGTRGRRKQNALSTMRWALAKSMYEDILLWPSTAGKAQRASGFGACCAGNTGGRVRHMRERLAS
jgi:hypothetical protein